jgi:hypothetical protein
MVWWDRVVLICLAVWALLFGIFHVTSIVIEHGRFIMGLAALVLGVVCVVRALK